MSRDDVQFLYLTTRGRRTGNPHTIEIWFVEHAGKYYLCSERASSHWVQNLGRDPKVTFEVGKQRYDGTARLVDWKKEETLGETATAKMKAKYGWSSRTLVELTPAPRKEPGLA